MIFSFYRLFKNQQFPQVGLFFGEKETLEESNEPSLIRVRWPAHFLFLCSKVQLSIPVSMTQLLLHTLPRSGSEWPVDQATVVEATT